jgi:hypothetical protein
MSANTSITSMTRVVSGEVTTGWVLLLIRKAVPSMLAGMRFSSSRWSDQGRVSALDPADPGRVSVVAPTPWRRESSRKSLFLSDFSLSRFWASRWEAKKP